MTEFDTPNLGVIWCPGCEPGRDPTREVLDTRWCDRHAPPREGADDDAVRDEGFMSGTAEAGGQGNRAVCDFFHRVHRKKLAVVALSVLVLVLLALSPVAAEDADSKGWGVVFAIPCWDYWFVRLPDEEACMTLASRTRSWTWPLEAWEDPPVPVCVRPEEAMPFGSSYWRSYCLAVGGLP